MTDIYREFLVSRSLISNEESLDKLKRFFSNLLVIFFGLISPCVALVSPNMLSAFFDFNTNRAEILKMYEHYYDNRNK